LAPQPLPPLWLRQWSLALEVKSMALKTVALTLYLVGTGTAEVKRHERRLKYSGQMTLGL